METMFSVVGVCLSCLVGCLYECGNFLSITIKGFCGMKRRSDSYERKTEFIMHLLQNSPDIRGMITLRDIRSLIFNSLRHLSL